MSITTTAPVTIEIRRGHLVGLVAAVAALIAALTFVLATRTVDSGAEPTRRNVATRENVLSSLSQEARRFVEGTEVLSSLELAAAYGRIDLVDALGLTTEQRTYVDGIDELSPEELAAAFGNVFTTQP